MKHNATDQIAKLLEKGKTLTRAKAMDKFQVLHLGDTIHRLRKLRGMDIRTLEQKLPSGKIIAKYKLAGS